MKKYFLFFVCLSFFVLFDNQLFGSQFNKTNNQMGSSLLLTGEDYITGEDGVPRMSVNVWGHVKYPGTYLVYDGIDILTCLSLAGGPLNGAKTSKISIISRDGLKTVVDLDLQIKNGNKPIILKPYDTIHINETLGNLLLTRSNILTTLLQLTNLILISNRD